MTDHSPELRAAGAEALAAGQPTHPHQDHDGTWYDVPCDCVNRPHVAAEATR